MKTPPEIDWTHETLFQPSNMIDTDTLRRINNHRHEYCTHPFERGAVGLLDFAILAERFLTFDDADLSDCLDLIDEIAAGHADCLSCHAKILAFCEIFTAKRLPERYKNYQEAYNQLVIHRRNRERDYRAEVRDIVGF